MDKLVKVILLTNNQILVSQIDGSSRREPTVN